MNDFSVKMSLSIIFEAISLIYEILRGIKGSKMIRVRYILKNSNKDLIATPSYDQVNKPIYTKSIGKWKKYENKISKIFPILNPWVDKFNYLK